MTFWLLINMHRKFTDGGVFCLQLVISWTAMLFVFILLLHVYWINYSLCFLCFIDCACEPTHPPFVFCKIKDHCLCSCALKWSTGSGNLQDTIKGWFHTTEMESLEQSCCSYQRILTNYMQRRWGSTCLTSGKKSCTSSQKTVPCGLQQ